MRARVDQGNVSRGDDGVGLVKIVGVKIVD
jgi:hypothetical protein